MKQIEIENIKEGTVIYKREWDYWHNTYSWTFKTVKKVTPKGKIRLNNGELLDSLGKYEIYNNEIEKIFIQDKIRGNVSDMIYYMANNKGHILNLISMEDIIKLGSMLESLKIENIDKWGRKLDKEYYEKSLDNFKKYIKLQDKK